MSDSTTTTQARRERAFLRAQDRANKRAQAGFDFIARLFAGNAMAWAIIIIGVHHGL